MDGFALDVEIFQMNRITQAVHEADPEVDPEVDPLAALRSATASRHQELDSGLAIGAPDASLEDYASHLTMLRAWLAPLQAWLDGFEDGPRFDQAGRLALIDQDLADQGMPAPPRTADAPLPWPSAASAAYRWGVCYVVEGSQLGGAVLFQRLHDRLAPHPLRYLKGIDAGPGPRWRVFMQALREHVHGQAEIDEACAGACAAFDGILALRHRSAS
jgi:heme oxygenase